MTTVSSAGQYPYAHIGGQLTHIREATPGPGYWCPGCQLPMEAVKGERAAWHFRHTSFQHCDEKKALYKTAIMLIQEVAQDAQQEGRPFGVTFRCRGS